MKHLRLFLMLSSAILSLLTSQPALRAAVEGINFPVGETKAFHGTLRAKDLRLGTLALSSSKNSAINRILALDAQSRLLKGVYPATLGEFTIGDVIEGFAFPDAHGRMVIAVATARARPLSAAESRPGKRPKARAEKSAGGSRRSSSAKSTKVATAPAPMAPKVEHTPKKKPAPAPEAPPKPPRPKKVVSKPATAAKK